MDNTYTPSGGSIPQMIVNDGLYAGHVTQTTDPVEITRLLEADAQAEQANPLPVDNINTNPMEVKQEMNKIIMEHTLPTPAPIPTPAEASLELLFQTIMNLATPYIERVVHAKFTEMVDNSLALTKLDADIEQRMREIAEEVAGDRVYDHERNENHWSEDYLDDKVADAVRENDLTERRIEEMISDAIENHTQETDHPDEGDIEHIVDQFTETNDFLTKSNIGENLDLEDKVRDALRGMTFDITPRY